MYEHLTGFSAEGEGHSTVGPSYSTGLRIKPYVKVMTQKLEWWIILMVDYCVTLFLLYNPPLHFTEWIRLQNIQTVLINSTILFQE